jgi:membrane protein DedA with SNARE-associated domain
MFQLLAIHDLSYYTETLGYLGIFIFFVTLDQVTPIPEEVSLLTIGYLASKAVFNPLIAGVIALFSFLLVDSIYFLLIKTGKKWSHKLVKKKDHSLLDRVKTKLQHNFPKTLFILCFIPRMRLWAPIASAAIEIPFTRFLKYDSPALAIFTALYIALGFIFHQGLHVLIMKLESLQNIIFASFAVVASIVIFILVRKYRRKN